MPLYPVLTQNDGVTPAVLVVATIQAGDTEGPLEYWVVNDPGETHADAETITGAILKIEAFDAASGSWTDSGLPILDEKWAKISVFGINDPHGAMVAQITGTVAIGSNSVVELAPITKGAARKFTLRVASPGTAFGVVQYRLKIVTGTATQAVGEKLELIAGSGVIPGSMIPGMRRIASGGVITAAGTDTLTVQNRLLDFDEIRYAFVQRAVVLDQNASDGAMIAGQSYIALISQTVADPPTVTKGAKGVVPVAPALPVDSVLLAKVTVAFHAGASVINQVNVDQTGMLVGDYSITAGAGLTVVIASGRGIAGDAYQFSDFSSIVVVPNAAVSYIWRTSASAYMVSATDIPPDPGADLVARVTTAGGVVTLVEDMREIITPAIVTLTRELSLTALLSAQIGVRLIPLAILPEALVLDEVTLDLSDKDVNWTGAGLKIDVFSLAPGVASAGAGVTIFTDFAVQDLRPRIAYNAASLRVSTKQHQVRRFIKGTRLFASIAEVPTTGAGEVAHTATVGLHFRRRA